MGEIKAVAVGLEAERFNFGDALDALLVQIVFRTIFAPQNLVPWRQGCRGPGNDASQKERPCHKYN